MTWVSDLAILARSRGNKDQSGLSYRLHYREICAPASSKLGLRKEWICNERPITISPIVTC